MGFGPEIVSGGGPDQVFVIVCVEDAWTELGALEFATKKAPRKVGAHWEVDHAITPAPQPCNCTKPSYKHIAFKMMSDD